MTFNQSEIGQGSNYPCLPPHEFSLCCTWLDGGLAQPPSAWALPPKPWEGHCARVKMLLCCSNYLTWINNQVGLRKAGKKATFNEGIIKFKFFSVNQTCSMLAKRGSESSAKGRGKCLLMLKLASVLSLVLKMVLFTLLENTFQHRRGIWKLCDTTSMDDSFHIELHRRSIQK